MLSFYLTFGQKYRTEVHPRFSLANPDGVVEINAVDYDDARALAVAIFGQSWSDLVGPDQWNNEVRDYYPDGVIVSFATEKFAERNPL